MLCATRNLLLLVLLAASPALAQAPAQSAGEATERGRSLARILDAVLSPRVEDAAGDRSLLLLLDPTESLGSASFAAEFDKALARNKAALSTTRIAVARVGESGRPALPPTREAAQVSEAVRRITDNPDQRLRNVYADLRRLAGTLSGFPGRRDILLVTLENGDAEDHLEATVAALRRSKVRVFVVAREAFLSDTYWVSHPERPPRGLTLRGGEAAFVEVPWGFLFQQAVANETVSSGFAMYGLSRVAVGSGGRVFLYYPPSSTGHRCTVYGACPFCSGDHSPRGRAYQAHRLRALAPAATPRAEFIGAAARDPYHQAVLRAWGRAAKAGLVRSRPSLRRAGAALRPEKRQLGSAAPLGGSLNFSGNAQKAERLARSCDQITSDLAADIARAETAGGSPRHRAVAELTRVMLRITRVNLLYFAAFCREVGPVLVRRDPSDCTPPELPNYSPGQRFVGIGYSSLSLCHGVAAFHELRLPGGEAMSRELAGLSREVEGFLSRHGHTPFAEAVRKSGIARFTFTVRGKYVPPPRRRPDSMEEEETATDRDRPTRGGGTGGGGGTATSGD